MLLKTGEWNAPQIISFDSLFEKYSINNVFTKKELEQITAVINRWKELVKDHYSKPAKKRPIIASYISTQPKLTRVLGPVLRVLGPVLHNCITFVGYAVMQNRP